MSEFHVNLHEAIYSLSDALDLVGVTHIHHGKRVAYMAAECGKRMEWTGKRLDDLFVAAMLHDCGVSKTIIHSRLAQLEWENEKDHCVIGGNLLASCPPLAGLSATVRHHHTHWSELKDMDLPLQTKLAANCIYMVDRVDILTLASLKDQSNILLGRNATRKVILDHRGDWFCEELVDAFLDVSLSEAFWFCLESEHVNSYTATWVSHDQTRSVDFDELRSLVQIFSTIVDAKSPFTREHSDGVAKLARYLGEQFSLSERSCDMLELAGLLHDLGKLRVPDALLDKPGKLSPEEYSQVQRHSFDTFNVLKGIHGLEEVTRFAAQHHERVDGSGYPYHMRNGSISLEARIIAVADVFQALAQRRPYRESMEPEAILAVLHRDVAEGKLDASVVDMVARNVDNSWRMAMGG